MYFEFLLHWQKYMFYKPLRTTQIEHFISTEYRYCKCLRLRRENQVEESDSQKKVSIIFHRIILLHSIQQGNNWIFISELNKMARNNFYLIYLYVLVRLNFFFKIEHHYKSLACMKQHDEISQLFVNRQSLIITYFHMNANKTRVPNRKYSRDVTDISILQLIMHSLFDLR